MRCSHCGFRNPAGFDYCGKCGKKIITRKEHSHLIALCHEVNESLAQHLKDSEKRPRSERLKSASDFKKKTGMPAAKAAENMRSLEKHLKNRRYEAAASARAPVKGLADYYVHLQKKAGATEKDPSKRKEELKFLGRCASTSLELAGLVATILG